MLRTILVAVAALTSADVWAQDAASFRKCVDVDNDVARLECFDRAAATAFADDAAEAPLLSMDGTGVKTSRPFDAPDGWEIRWHSAGSLMFSVQDTATGLPVAIASSSGEPEGSTYVGKGGRLTIEVIGFQGAWSIEAWAVE